MRGAAVFVAILFVVMTLGLVYGFTQGDGWDEVALLVQYPWFNVSLIDVYVGFALFCGWVVTRESSLPLAIVWVVAILLLGNAVACLYALFALRQSQGDWGRFWRGRHVVS